MNHKGTGSKAAGINTLKNKKDKTEGKNYVYRDNGRSGKGVSEGNFL